MLQSDHQNTSASVSQAADDAKNYSNGLSLIGTWLPIALLVLGVLFLALAMLMQRRRRPAPPTAYTGPGRGGGPSGPGGPGGSGGSGGGAAPVARVGPAASTAATASARPAGSDRPPAPPDRAGDPGSSRGSAAIRAQGPSTLPIFATLSSDMPLTLVIAATARSRPKPGPASGGPRPTDATGRGSARQDAAEGTARRRRSGHWRLGARAVAHGSGGGRDCGRGAAVRLRAGLSAPEHPATADQARRSDQRPDPAPLHPAAAPAAGTPETLPQTDALPRSDDPVFQAGVQALWRGIVTGDVSAALPFFFPRAAYIQVKGISDPIHDYQTAAHP